MDRQPLGERAAGMPLRSNEMGSGSDDTTLNLLYEISREETERPGYSGGTFACSVYRTIRQINALSGE